MSDREIVFQRMTLDGKVTHVRTLTRGQIDKCRFVILVPEHYRDDGTCKCDDAEHRAHMIAEWDYTLDDFKGIPLRKEGR